MFRLQVQLLLFPSLAAVPLAGGCGVQRTLEVESSPPGALVYLNGEETGRTPMRKNFLWYGTYDVELRKEGYQTLAQPTKVWAPWWQWPPMDLLAELIPGPLEDRHVVRYTLRPLAAGDTDPEQVLGRAVQMRGRLKSSRYPRQSKEKRAAPATEAARE